jgi:hypothetical protein
VLLLTALDALADRVRGLDLGADDYLAGIASHRACFAGFKRKELPVTRQLFLLAAMCLAVLQQADQAGRAPRMFPVAMAAAAFSSCSMFFDFSTCLASTGLSTMMARKAAVRSMQATV